MRSSEIECEIIDSDTHHQVKNNASIGVNTENRELDKGNRAASLSSNPVLSILKGHRRNGKGRYIYMMGLPCAAFHHLHLTLF